MKLLREVNECQIIKEDVAGVKNYTIKGIFLQGGMKNRNDRIYPIQTLIREVQNYTANYISKRRSLGELNHPDTPSINYDRVSHLITELKQDGKNFIGVAKVLDTPPGRIAKALMDEGCMLAVSSRGLGSLKDDVNGAKVVQDDFMLTTAADLVHDPSAPEAFVENILESADWVMNAGDWVPQFREQIVKPTIDRTSTRDFERVALGLFESFIRKL